MMKNLLVALVAVSVVYMMNRTTKTDGTKEPRGIRNNNPGNIEYTGVAWKGLANPPSDGRFMRFVDPAWGLRALARVLVNYQRLHGIDTVRGIINRWAPSFENNTTAYMSHVADYLEVGVDEKINIEERLFDLIVVIVQHENGKQPYSAKQINSGIELAVS